MTAMKSVKRQRSDMPKLDRRQGQRVKINVLGRYMLSDHREFACQIRDMSPAGLAMTAPVIGKINEVVIVYIDHIGRVEGKITRLFDGGFAVSIRASAKKRDKLASVLTWLANRHELNLPEDRRHSREAPRDPFTTITLPDGTQKNARILDMSLSGAALAVDVPVRVGEPLIVGKIKTRVVRKFDEGIAVEFATARKELPVDL